MKRFEDYKQDVILAYKKKKKEGKLPPNLQRHTPANLKKEFINVFPERYSNKDNNTFNAFFNKGKSAEEYLRMIKDAEPEAFKALNNFLRGSTTDPRDPIIEMLAWLIDYEPRPHQYADISELVKRELDANLVTSDQKTEIHEETREESKVEELKAAENIADTKAQDIIEEVVEETPLAKKDGLSITKEDLGVPRKFNRAIVAFFAAFVIISGTYLFYNTGSNECMYWDVDHYKEMRCDQKVDGAAIIALDTFRLAHLKKITNFKLITPNSIGKIHYSKIDGKVEFYTTGGENPTDNRKRLLPMTEFIYKKYVLKSIN